MPATKLWPSADSSNEGWNRFLPFLFIETDRCSPLPGALCDAIRIAKDSDFITKYLPEKARTAFFAAKQAEHDRIVLADDRTAAERSLYFERY